MPAHLLINGKKYFPSSSLCMSFGYTSDYLGKLAREEKILGTLVDRQWFIEKESLKTFLIKTEIEKKILKEELSLQRKLERKSAKKIVSSQSTQRISVFSPVTFAQTFVIVLCGVFMGSLGWLGAVAGVGPNDLFVGSKASVTQLAEVFSPYEVVNNFSFGSDMLLATVLLSDAENLKSEQSTESDVFTQLPEFPDRSTTSRYSASSQGEQFDAMGNQFSDEVLVVTDSTGQKIIEPVFKTASTTKPRFVLIPVKDEGN